MHLSVINKINYCGAPCIGLACEDLKKDFLRTGNCAPKICESSLIEKGAVNVGTIENPEFAAAAKEYFTALPSCWEEYSVAICEDKIVIIGTDKRAAMWGIYSISRLLGVPACIRYSGGEVKKCSELESCVYSDKPQTYKFRGWFLNDEDLLCRQYTSGGQRSIDYLYYKYIADVRAYEPIVETALRLGINMIIPGSLIDIDDPWQEKLVSYCAQRGMYVSQHHVEPLGVSHFTYKAYYEKQGKESEFSFVSNREDAIEIWKYYVKKWAKYGDDVIWQLGLRGKADRPVWYHDNAENSRAAWGDIISDAIQTQYNLVKEQCGESFYSTSTLWMEGSALYSEGFLKFPQSTMLIFADAGPTQMLSTDFFEVPRENRDYGMYYHIAYWGDGPHLAQGTDFRKMLFNYDNALEKGDTAYSILNVSNVRELVMSAAANSEIIWNREAFDADKFLEKWCAEYYGNSEIKDIFADYFAAFIEADKEDLESRYGEFFDFYYCDVPFPYYTANDGLLRLLAIEVLRRDKKHTKWIPRLEDSIRRFEAVLKKAESYPATEYFDWFKFQIKYMIYHETWVLASCKYAENGDVSELIPGRDALKTYLEERKQFETGEFENWYLGDEKMDFPKWLDVLEYMLKNGGN